MRIRKSRRVAGFTLVELMVVVAIIGLLAAVVTVNVMGQGHTARVERTKADMRSIGDALNLYKIDTGVYPQQLNSLWERPAQARKWNGPYLQEYPPRDPWGSEYIYNYSGGREYEIISYGAGDPPAPGGTEEAADLSSRTINNQEAQ